MACSISFSNLVNGQSVMLPYQVNGYIMLLPGAAQLRAASRQIDDNPLADLDTPDVDGMPGMFAFAVDLTSTELSQAGEWHMLSIYAWDDAQTAATLTSVTFQVMQSLTLPPPSPPPSPPPTCP